MEQEHPPKRSLAAKYKLANIDFTDQGIQYTCVECQAAYFDKEQLEIHLCTHFKEYRFLCGICGTGLKRKEHLDRHTLGHQEVRPHVCEECGKGFKRKEHLNIHRSIHSGDKSHFCVLCNRSFYRKDHLQKHLQTHSKHFIEGQEMLDSEFVDVKQEIEGSQSGDGLEYEGSLELDEENNSQPELEKPPKDPNRPFECPVCHKTYKRRDHLKLHSFTHMEKDKICSECGKAFHREEQLLIHMHTHLQPYPGHNMVHVKEEPDMDVHAMFDHTEIDIMPLDMDESSLLIPRVQYGESPPSASAPRPHECPTCHRRFKRKQHLKVHANVHLRLAHQQRPAPTIWCSLCNEGFVNNEQFEGHQCPGSVMDESGEYAEHTDPDEHTAITHDAKKENHPQFELFQLSESSLQQERHIPQPQKVYVCKYCNKPFRRKDHYKIHLHIHTGVRSFFCPHCGKGFYRKDHMQKHLQVHEKRGPLPAPRPSLSSRPHLPSASARVPPVSAAPSPARQKRQPPALFPLHMLHKKEVHDVSKQEIRPEITITAPSNSALRVPLQIKVPYQVVMSMDNGEQRSVTVDPTAQPTLVA